jgi:hypothetical protein
MIDHPKGAISNMAALNNEIVAILDASKVTPCEAVMVLTLIRSSLITTFEVRATKEEG